jgi:hypothetical protein
MTDGLVGEAKPDTAHCMQVTRSRRYRFNLLAKQSDINVERTLIAVEVCAPDCREQALTLDYGAFCFCEKVQYVKLAR